MSLALFNGVASNQNLNVNSIVFQDGTSLGTATAVNSSYTTGGNNITGVSGTPYVIGSFTYVDAGVYILTFAYSVSTADVFSGVSFYVETGVGPTIQVFSTSYREGTGTSGFNQYTRTFSTIINLPTASPAVIIFTNNNMVTGGATFTGTRNTAIPFVLVKLI